MSRRSLLLLASLAAVGATSAAAATPATANPLGCAVEPRVTTRPVLAQHNRQPRSFYLSATYRCSTPMTGEHEVQWVYVRADGRRFTREFGAGGGNPPRRASWLLAANESCSAWRPRWRGDRVVRVGIRVALYERGGFAADGRYRGDGLVTTRSSRTVRVSSLCP